MFLHGFGCVVCFVKASLSRVGQRFQGYGIVLTKDRSVLNELK